MSIGQKVILGFVLAIAILIVIDAASYRSISSLVRDSDWQVHTHQVLDELDGVLAQLNNAETGQRGYLLTGEESYLEPYHTAIRAIDDEIDRLRVLTRDNSSHQRRLVVLDELVDHKFAELSETIETHRSEGFAASVQIVRTDRGKRVMDQLRQIVAAMKAEELALLDERARRTEAQTRRAFYVIGLGSLFGLLLGGAAGYIIHADVAERERDQQRLLREIEERLAVERRLRQAEKLAALGRFTGGVAHQLGSSQSVVTVRAEQIRSDPRASPTIRRYAGAILEEVNRVTQLVRGLAHVARREPVLPKPVNLGEVVRAVVTILRARIAAAGVRLTVEVPKLPVMVNGDPVLLNHAIANLVANAIDALSDSPEERSLRIRLDVTADRAEVIIRDNGPGIASDHLPHLFEPFFTTKDVGKGTGLGLAISRGIMQEHGGDVQLTAGTPGGIVATCTLPLADETAPGGEAA